MSRYLLAVGVAAVVVAIAYFFDLTKMLGAHPFWSSNVLLIGTGIGLILGLIVGRLPYIATTLGLLLATLVCYAAANWGKTTFAASYADDAFAGQVWYFSWFAVCACAVACLFRALLGKKQLPNA